MLVATMSVLEEYGPNNKTKLAKFQLQIGHTYYNQRNFEQALTAYNLLLREYPQSKETVEARRQIAHIHRRDDKWDKAIAEYKLIIKNQGEYKTVDRIPITLTGAMNFDDSQISLP